MDERESQTVRLTNPAGALEAVPSRPASYDTPLEVRCPSCGLLLAKKRDFATIEIHWKELQLTAWGRARVRCRKCGTLTEI